MMLGRGTVSIFQKFFYLSHGYQPGKVIEIPIDNATNLDLKQQCSFLPPSVRREVMGLSELLLLL